MMMPGLIVLIRASRSPHWTASNITRSESALGKLIGVQRVLYLVGLQYRQLEQLLDRRFGKGVVLFRRKRRQPMAGLRCDDDARAPSAITLPNSSRGWFRARPGKRRRHE
jgi:hypothetical protein